MIINSVGLVISEFFCFSEKLLQLKKIKKKTPLFSPCLGMICQINLMRTLFSIFTFSLEFSFDFREINKSYLFLIFKYVDLKKKANYFRQQSVTLQKFINKRFVNIQKLFVC